MPRQVKLAILLAFLVHGAFILSAQYRLSYDAYNHMFFADHYLRDWWTLWETRWYTGFQVVSYPPLTHQLIASFGRLVGVDAGYGLLQWLVAAAYPLAAYRFSRIFTGRAAAGYAALGAALLPSIYLTAYTFGQLPTLAASLLALFGAAVLADFLRQGDALSGVLAAALFASTMAAHHATLLFLPALVGAVFLHYFFQRRAPRLKLLARLGLVGLLAAPLMLAVIWPFWDWGRGQAIQTPIDHLARHNFFSDPVAALVFFLPMYGSLIVLIPLLPRWGLRRRFWGLGLAFLALFLLGLGDTTPLPRLLFGPGWAWLTYERFSFWATLVALPFLGLWLAKLGRAIAKRRVLWPQAGSYYLAAQALVALVVGSIPAWLPTQPKQLDMRPIVDYLAQADRAQYRYLTFGFGDQLAYLSRLTPATTIDGSYHTARSLPELRTSGIGQIDTAYWLAGGMAALDPILEQAGLRGVRWGFVDLLAYEPVLQAHGWVERASLSNGVKVWENPSAILPPATNPPAEAPLAQFSWGVFPLLALSLSGGLALRRYWPRASAQTLPVIQAVALGLLPLSLGLWYYRRLWASPQPNVYFTYSDALFFLSDGLALAFLLAWAIERWPAAGSARPRPAFRPWKAFTRPQGWLLALCVLASLSTLWSLDWRTSLYVSLHLWLGLALFLALRQTPQAWRWFSLGGCAALAVQLFIGIWQFAAQSTAMNLPLGLNWPGTLLPAQSGVIVVQLADGTRWLRAYGTLAHPNLLGGFALTVLAAALALYLHPARARLLPLVLFNGGLVLLVLSFSRSAWVGLAVLSAVLLFHWKKLGLKKLALPAVTALLIAAVLAAWLFPLLFTRLADNQVKTEQISYYTRLWLMQRTQELIQKRPLLGSGVGTYSLALWQHVAPFNHIEPVHNIPLLVTSELGIGGLLLLVGLAVVTVLGTLKARSPAGLVFSGLVLGLFAISMFDHYFWTLAPPRLLWFATLGLWAGQIEADKDSGQAGVE